MKICAIELKSNEANLCLLSNEQGLFEIHECRAQKVMLVDSLDNEQMKNFQFTFKKLMDDYQVTDLVIRTREMKGKFSGSAIGFKMEAALQLTEGLKVHFMTGNDIKEKLKRNPLAIDFKSTGLRQFQENAFVTGYAFLSK